jgi:hypothetical protein
MKKLGMVTLAALAFGSGMLCMFNWVGHDDGRTLHSMLKRPDVIERPVEVQVVKIVAICDEATVQGINQEYRDTLLKITQAEYNPCNGGGKDNRRTIERCRSLAEKALAFPETIAAQQVTQSE